MNEGNSNMYSQAGRKGVREDEGLRVRVYEHER